MVGSLNQHRASSLIFRNLLFIAEINYENYKKTDDLFSNNSPNHSEEKEKILARITRQYPDYQNCLMVPSLAAANLDTVVEELMVYEVRER